MHVIFQWNIGGSSSDNAVRMVGHGIPENGWRWFKENKVDPALEWAEKAGVIASVQLHNPFGTLHPEKMQFDQWEHALRTGLTWLTEDFVSTFRSMHLDREVIAYIGSPHLDPQFNLDATYDGRFDNMFHHWWQNTRPYLECGMSIAWDVGNEITNDVYSPPNAQSGASPQVVNMIAHLMQILEIRGVKQYIESPCRYDQPWPWRYNQMGLERAYANRHDPTTGAPSNGGKWPRADSGDWYTHRTPNTEFVRIFSGHQYRDRTERIEHIRDAIKQGHTPAIRPWQFQNDMTLSEVLGI